MECKGVGVGLRAKAKKGPAGKRLVTGYFPAEACFTDIGI